MLTVDGEVAEVSVDGEPVGRLGCNVTSTRAVPGRWWRRARLSEVWLDYSIEWASPAPMFDRDVMVVWRPEMSPRELRRA